jgi:hypothetical protein
MKEPLKKVFKFYAYMGLILLLILSLSKCSGGGTSGSYVEGSIDRRGRYRKPHFRKSVSTDPHAYRNRARSRYYYHTRGKYLR